MPAGCTQPPATSFQLSNCVDVDISITARWSQGERGKRKGLAWPEVALDFLTHADRRILGCLYSHSSCLTGTTSAGLCIPDSLEMAFIRLQACYSPSANAFFFFWSGCVH